MAGTRERPEAVAFTQTAVGRRPVPWGRIATGDPVWMKWSGGPIVAKAVVEQFVQLEDCDPSKLRKIVARTLLHDLDEYWSSLPRSFFGMAVFCKDAEWLDQLIFPAAKGYMSSWIVLDTSAKEESWLTDIGEDQPQSMTSRSISLSLRFAVLRRAGFTCTYCGRSPPEVKLHVDHVIPWSKGGRTEIANLRAACSDCNLGKGATSI